MRPSKIRNWIPGLGTGLPPQRYAKHTREAELESGYDELMKRKDPALIKMQFQDAISPQCDPVAILATYSGRYISLHLWDWSAERKTVPIGAGTIDWNRLFTAANARGIKNYFVEMDWDLMQSSVPYLRKLKL